MDVLSSQGWAMLAAAWMPAGAPVPGLLAGLFVFSLLAATLLPGGSELLLLGLVQQRPELLGPAFLVATLGNTAGGALSYAMGRGLVLGWGRRRPDAVASPPSAARQRALAWLQRHGAPACAMSWLPLVGDPLCLLAGALRLPARACLLWMALGKGARYALLLAGLQAWGG